MVLYLHLHIICILITVTADAQMFFYVDSAEELAAKIGDNVKVITEEPYYRYIPKNSLKLSTKVSMAVSDQFKMVKMICLKT